MFLILLCLCVAYPRDQGIHLGEVPVTVIPEVPAVSSDALMEDGDSQFIVESSLLPPLPVQMFSNEQVAGDKPEGIVDIIVNCAAQPNSWLP